MKTKKQWKLFPWLILGMGFAGLMLRWQLYALAVDERGLLLRGHPVEWVLWGVTAAAAAVIVMAVWKQGTPSAQDNKAYVCTQSGVGAFVLAAAIVLTVLLDREIWTVPEKARYALGFLAAIALVEVGVHRIQGKAPQFFFHGVVCVFFAVHMISRYQAWSSNPQLQDSLFSLLGCIFLALFAYYQAAFDADCGKGKLQLATGLAAVYTCIVTLSQGEYPLLYLGGAVWAFTNLPGGAKPFPREGALPDEEEPRE